MPFSIEDKAWIKIKNVYKFIEYGSCRILMLQFFHSVLVKEFLKYDQNSQGVLTKYTVF